MAHNTRSKNSRKMTQKTQFDNHNNLSDEEIAAETYGTNKEPSPSRQPTKKAKTDTIVSAPSSPTNNKNNMDIDINNEKEHLLSSEKDVTSRDSHAEDHQTPIVNEQKFEYFTTCI
uniref:Uncharacterized protein n=2 Tax=Rhizophagus irregularis TaxID=588596 RepID=U9TUQ5_RHIID